MSQMSAFTGQVWPPNSNPDVNRANPGAVNANIWHREVGPFYTMTWCHGQKGADLDVPTVGVCGTHIGRLIWPDINQCSNKATNLCTVNANSWYRNFGPFLTMTSSHGVKWADLPVPDVGVYGTRIVTIFWTQTWIRVCSVPETSTSGASNFRFQTRELMVCAKMPQIDVPTVGVYGTR